ncbi:beta-lactamase/transpeptidase-like protein [Xylariaceae sp. FL0255]|nr:beta-lactamase/transpeptidase-like protein [Xylariaceae sp. FL0255]
MRGPRLPICPVAINATSPLKLSSIHRIPQDGEVIQTVSFNEGDMNLRAPTASMAQILCDRIPVMRQILDQTQQPGLSIGVIHQGEEVLKHNFGVRDIESGMPPDSDTIYCIASLSKAFMSASLDLLVQERKLSWDSPIVSIIPEFRHISPDNILSHMTVRDICSHRTGLQSLDEITQGLDARILIPKQDLVQVCNALPVKHDLRTRFLYNNALYELAGHVVERRSEHSNWGDFQNVRIFKPLGMERTTAFRAIHETDDNVATPYVILTDGKPSKVPPTELSANSMNGGSGGIRSSVNDLLKWCHCVLQSLSGESNEPALLRRSSPVFDRLTMASHLTAEKGEYCAGWCYHRTPGIIGLISPNRGLSVGSSVLGCNSASHVLYGHQGDVPGYTCNLYIIAETTSAIVILSNGTGLSDATDWIAQDVIQAMAGLRPAIDFVDIAAKAKAEYLTRYSKHYVDPLNDHRIAGTRCAPLEEFVGLYIMDGLSIASIEMKISPRDPTRLQMMINRQSDQALDMWHYHYDVFCHLPGSYDECLSRGFYRETWDSTLISFRRNATQRVALLC